MQGLKSLPGLGYRSAEKIALHLLVEKPERAAALCESIQDASNKLGPCETCGNLTEGKVCSICLSEEREDSIICVVESVTDLHAMERSGVFRGKYHVLQGKLSPIRGIGLNNSIYLAFPVVWNTILPTKLFWPLVMTWRAKQPAIT